MLAPDGPRWATVAEDARFEVRALEAGADGIVIDSAPNAEVVGWSADDGLYARRAWV